MMTFNVISDLCEEVVESESFKVDLFGDGRPPEVKMRGRLVANLLPVTRTGGTVLHDPLDQLRVIARHYLILVRLFAASLNGFELVAKSSSSVTATFGICQMWLLREETVLDLALEIVQVVLHATLLFSQVVELLVVAAKLMSTDI
jgi:hypothetical protein